MRTYKFKFSRHLLPLLLENKNLLVLDDSVLKMLLKNQVSREIIFKNYSCVSFIFSAFLYSDMLDSVIQSVVVILWYSLCCLFLFLDTEVWWSKWGCSVCSWVFIWEDLFRAVRSGWAPDHYFFCQKSQGHFRRTYGIIFHLIF